MDVERLIEEVRENGVLYDRYHEKYMDTKYKERIWEEIGAILEQPGSVCKSKWINIRDQFRRYHQKRWSKSGEAAKKVVKYKYGHLLEFLHAHFSERNSLSDIAEAQYDEESQFIEDDINDHDVKEDWPLVARNEVLPPQSSDTVDSFRKSHLRKKRAVVKHKTASQKTAPAKLMNYIIESSRKKGVDQDIHPVDAFLSSIAPTLKSLSPLNLNIAKSKIFSIVQEMEINEIMAKEGNTTVLDTGTTPSHSTSSAAIQCKS